MIGRDDEFEIYNDTDSPLPAGGLCLWSGGFTRSGQLKVVKPTADDQLNLVVAGDFLTPANGSGKGSFNPRTLLLFDPRRGLPSPGDTLGSVKGEWAAKKGGSGFKVYGGTAGTLAAVVRDASAAVDLARLATNENCTGFGWLARLKWWDCIRAYELTAGTDGAVRLKSTAEDEPFVSVADVTVCRANFQVSFTRRDVNGKPVLVMTRTGGAGSGDEDVELPALEVEGQIDCSGCNYVIFAFDPEELCVCVPADSAGGPCGNLVRIRVEWYDCGPGAVCCVGAKLPMRMIIRNPNGWKIGGYDWDDVDVIWDTDQGAWVGGVEIPDGFGGFANVPFRLGCGPWVGNLTEWSVGIGDGIYIRRETVVGELCSFPVDFETNLVRVAGSGLDPLPPENESGVVGISSGNTGVAGWKGEGWYVLTDGRVVYLTAADGCDPATSIRCGRYNTAAAAQAACGDDEGGSGEGSGSGDCDEIPGWDGDGWYPVLDGTECVALPLEGLDRCDTDIVILGPRFDTEFEAAAWCSGSGDDGPGSEDDGGGGGEGSGSVEECCDSYPATLPAQATGPFGGGCSLQIYTTVAGYVGGGEYQYSTGTGGGVRVYCQDGEFFWLYYHVFVGGPLSGLAGGLMTRVGSTLTGSGNVSGGSCHGSPISVVIDHPCP